MCNCLNYRLLERTKKVAEKRKGLGVPEGHLQIKFEDFISAALCVFLGTLLNISVASLTLTLTS